MAISPTGPLTLTDIQTEFGGSNPISLSEYYAGGSFVQVGATGDNGAIPSSGQIEMSKFFGSASVIPMEFLVIAGGGGGGMGAGLGGGGGAGGMRTSTESNVAPGTVITVIVGAGGGSTDSRFLVGTNGLNSSISSPGITNLSTVGGGRGGSQDVFTPDHGGALGGGSGGGGSTANPGPASGGTGTSGEGNAGGQGGRPATPTGIYGGGGGGKGSAGQSGTVPAQGTGGAGEASPVTGTPVFYASGGAGGPGGAQPGGGGNNGAIAQNGQAYFGGGGGGGNDDDSNPAAISGTGGTGVVIMNVPTSKYTGTTTGSPDISVSGPLTIIKFTGSGSYTV